MVDLARALRQTDLSVAPRLSVLPHGRSGLRERPAGAWAARRRLARLQEASKGSNATALQVAALIALVYSRSDDAAASTRAIDLLQKARSLGPPAAPVLVDLSAAYLERAERAQSLADVPRALQAATDALRLDPQSISARYNLALALDRLTLDERARGAWESVAATATDPATAREARSRVLALVAHERMPRPADTGPPARWAAYTAREPQHARLYAMDTLLARWGRAVSASDSADARKWLDAAGSVGEALERSGGDPSLLHQVRSIRAAAGQPGRQRALASAHAQYGRGQVLLGLRKARAAQSALDSARANAAGSPALGAWADYWRGVALFYDGQPDLNLFRQILTRAETRGYPALTARAHWSLSTLHGRAGAYDSALAHLGRSAGLYERLGEREHLGAVQELEAETRLNLGDDAGAYAAARRALGTLRPYRDSVRLHNLLMALGRAVSLEGLGDAAAALHDEDVAVAARIRPAVHLEAVLSRARNAALMGDLARAEADLRTGETLLRAELARGGAGTAPSVDSTYEQKWLRADLREAHARLQVRADPAAAAAALDPVVRFFGEAPPAVDRLLPALVLRAEARLAAGDSAGATADLDRASGMLDRMGGSLANVSLRAAMLNAGRRVFDRLALLRAANPAAALAALERGRLSFGGARRLRRDLDRRIAAPAGTLVVDYALVGDTLLMFTVSDTTVWLEKRTVDAARLLRVAEHARVSLELRAATDSVAADLSLLYDALVRPVQARLEGRPRVVIIADGELAGIPFQALRDTVRGRYLLHDHEVRFSSSLADAHAVAAPGAGGRPLFVADPAFRAMDYPGLQRLGGLAAETRALASTHAGAVTLADLAATPDSLRARLPTARFFYFAGHAVFDDARPERSYLLLAPDGQRDDGRLTAEEIASMNLSAVRLVVLSACETQRSVSGRAGGFAGLSRAMLSAGAGGVVGSLWRVDDAYTRALMAEFHQAYRRSADAAAALRHAQLRLLNSTDASLRSPAAWAGFRYAGADLS